MREFRLIAVSVTKFYLIFCLNGIVDYDYRIIEITYDENEQNFKETNLIKLTHYPYANKMKIFDIYYIEDDGESILYDGVTCLKLLDPNYTQYDFCKIKPCYVNVKVYKFIKKNYKILKIFKMCYIKYFMKL